MRKISAAQILTLMPFYGLGLYLAFRASYRFWDIWHIDAFSALLVTISGIILFYAFLFILFRLFNWIFPLPLGQIKHNSKEEFKYHIYLLFSIMGFHVFMRSYFLPVPLMRLISIAMGAKIGPNSYYGGTLHDPPFVTIGHDCLLGQASLIIPHSIEGRDISHQPIWIGNNVTVGANAVILQGVRIEDNAIVAAGAVVSKNTHIGKNEIWGGIPARFIKVKNEAQDKTIPDLVGF